jgi:predicted nucleic acid-binding protein
LSLILDSAPLIALMDRRDRLHAAVARALKEETGPLVLPAAAAAEVDHLAGVRLGRRAREGFYADLAQGSIEVACLEAEDYGLLQGLDQRYADLDVGLVDLSIVILAHRFGTRRILTFDERHFRALRPIGGGEFTLLPADGTRSRRRTS